MEGYKPSKKYKKKKKKKKKKILRYKKTRTKGWLE